MRKLDIVHRVVGNTDAGTDVWYHPVPTAEIFVDVKHRGLAGYCDMDWIVGHTKLRWLTIHLLLAPDAENEFTAEAAGTRATTHADFTEPSTFDLNVCDGIIDGRTVNYWPIDVGLT